MNLCVACGDFTSAICLACMNSCYFDQNTILKVQTEKQMKQNAGNKHRKTINKIMTTND